jgi:hypothetical protein
MLATWPEVAFPGPASGWQSRLIGWEPSAPDILEQSTCFQPKAVSHGRLQTSYRAEA